MKPGKHTHLKRLVKLGRISLPWFTANDLRPTHRPPIKPPAFLSGNVPCANRVTLREGRFPSLCSAENVADEMKREFEISTNLLWLYTLQRPRSMYAQTL